MKFQEKVAGDERLMNLEAAADALESLGNSKRLAVFRLLVRAGPDGLPVGKIQESLAISPSTLTHHISRLAQSGLVHQVREGRVIRCCAGYREMSRLIDFLMEECCEGQGANSGRNDVC